MFNSIEQQPKMEVLIVFLPLLGLIRGQMNGPLPDNKNERFFNDVEHAYDTFPPWSEPANAPNALSIENNASGPIPIAGSPSSTKPPGGAAPIGGPQLPAVAGANADPSKSGGSSAGIAGFGAVDYFNGIQSPKAPAAGGGNTETKSGRQNNGFFGLDGGIAPGIIDGGEFDSVDFKEKLDANKASRFGTAASTAVGVVVSVIIAVGVFALVAVFLVRQRRQLQSRFVIGSA